MLNREHRHPRPVEKMRRKDATVHTEFHPIITAFAFYIDDLYRAWGDELVVTSGSEPGTRHGYTSLHYATPCQAIDIRSRKRAKVPGPHQQKPKLEECRNDFCDLRDMPRDWIEIILESNHFHIEYQPKRGEGV